MPSTSQYEPEVGRSSPDLISKPPEDLDLINALSDDDLLSIFKRLPPYERLLVSEVCKRWLIISRKPWLDLAHLELRPIPGPNIAAVIKQCPNLSGVLAVCTSFDLNELQSLLRTNLSALKLYKCAALVRETGSATMDPLTALFGANMSSFSWDELVLHDVRVVVANMGAGPWLASYFVAELPLTLRRLQISGYQTVDYREGTCEIEYGRGISQLRQLECLMLRRTVRDDITWTSFKWLRELYISDECGRNFNKGFFARLPKLEVLFVHSYFRRNFDLSETTKHPSLRILVLTGYYGRREVEFPMRPLYANFNSTDPMPKLHIFVGRQASRMILFPKFLPEAAKVYPITEPLPQFLGRADIKPIFEGVWIAAKIRAAVSHRSPLFDYMDDVAVSLRSLNA